MNNIKKPKRRRYKDNSYSLLYEGEYEIKLTTNGKTKILKVNQDLYEAFNKFELEDLKEMNVIDEIIKEPEIEESEACEVVSQNLKNEILKAIKKYAKI